MSTEPVRAHVTNYEGTDIYVDEMGYFYATPPGCRKERKERFMREIKHEIRTVVDRSRNRRRQDANHGVYIFDEKDGTVDVNAMYIGVRGTKNTKYGDAGHLFQLSGKKETTSGDLRIVPGYTSQEDILALEAAHELMRAAQEEYRVLKLKTTNRLHLGYYSDYNKTADVLLQEQTNMLAKIRKAQEAIITKDSTA